MVTKMNKKVNANLNIEVFISYSSKNEEIASLIAEGLEDRGVKYWKAGQYTINSGEDFREKIASALKECKIFLIILSKDSMNSPWVKLELTEALRNNKKIYSLKIDEYPLDELFDFKLGCSQISDGTKNLNSVIENLSINIRKTRDELVSKSKNTLINQNKNLYMVNASSLVLYPIFLLIIIFLISLLLSFKFPEFKNFYTFSLIFLIPSIAIYLFIDKNLPKQLENYITLHTHNAEYILFVNYSRFFKSKKSKKIGLQYLIKASIDGSYKASFKLSKFYKKGKYFEKNLELSEEYYKKGLEQQKNSKSSFSNLIISIVAFTFLNILNLPVFFSFFDEIIDLFLGVLLR